MPRAGKSAVYAASRLCLLFAFNRNLTSVFCLFDPYLLWNILHKLLPVAYDSHQFAASCQVY